MAELFLLILMVVVFCAWLHHKTNGFSSLKKNSHGCRKDYKQTDWEDFDDYLSDSYLLDPGDPGSYFYNFIKN